MTARTAGLSLPAMDSRLDGLIAEILALPEGERQEIVRMLLARTSSSVVREAAANYLDLESSGLKGMKSVLVRLPEELVSEAQAAGLLADKPFEDLIRRALREQASGASINTRKGGGRPLQLPVYRGKGGLAKGIDPRSNRSMLDAADDDT